MSLRRRSTLVPMLLALGLVAGCATAEPHTAEPHAAEQVVEVVAEEPAEPMDMEAMMAEYTRIGTPGEHHERMARLAGAWTVTGKLWMDPSQPPVDSVGEAQFTSELGGRWVRHVYETTMMGQPYRGIGMDGFDNARGKYVSYWFDSMATACFVQEGTYDAATRTLTAEGSTFDPVMQVTKYTRMVTVDRSDDEFVMTMYELPGGPETLPGLPGDEPIPMMELVYKRRK